MAGRGRRLVTAVLVTMEIYTAARKVSAETPEVSTHFA